MIGYDELAERWGVTKDQLYLWKHRGKLPEFDVDIGTHPARVVGWDEKTIEKLEDDNARGIGTSGG